MSKSTKAWTVYLLRCSDGTLYCGITTDITRRINEHNNSKKGARYTRSRRPVSLIGFKECESHSSAAIQEIKIKKMNREGKLMFFRD